MSRQKLDLSTFYFHFTTISAKPSHFLIVMNSLPFRLLFSLVLLAWCAADASAAEGSTGFWTGFRRYWGSVFGDVSGAVLVALACGAFGIFIIVRGKKKLD